MFTVKKTFRRLFNNKASNLVLEQTNICAEQKYEKAGRTTGWIDISKAEVEHFPGTDIIIKYCGNSSINSY